MQPDFSKQIKKWFEFASHDLRVSKLCLEQNDEAFLKAAAFHLQLSVEKVLKGVLTSHKIKFNKTHNLIELGSDVVSIYPDSNEFISTVIPLNKYIVMTRYPTDQDINKNDVLKMLPLAQKLYDYFYNKLSTDWDL